ncbi:MULTISPECIES: hypothetical protein [unclassified Methylobacterium]|uniref:hypothetical protein n=1 Tax=unclassified Methylobacterium TaxID=2615210 RepID=UPI0008A7F96B|nr:MULTISPECIES: hypothetical protein [unclassified Methylobacterium]SEH26239.1 hypothetical protein SAMN02799636_00360 [Methylobacterium sp. 275MFSha3.1]SFD83962.1 hypothetical protein SAMN02799627_01773 [Methylobacterium sp. 13MFTsu3.1M2]SFS76808.1 hypothetical protein SAMN04487845_10742 [Methylobacterium sp. yr668]
MGNGDGSGAPSAKIAEVQRLATALAARVRYAQLVGRPVYEAQISALVGAARLMDEERAPWPPMVEEVLTELARAIEGTEPAAEGEADDSGGDPAKDAPGQP